MMRHREVQMPMTVSKRALLKDLDYFGLMKWMSCLLLLVAWPGLAWLGFTAEKAET